MIRLFFVTVIIMAFLTSFYIEGNEKNRAILTLGSKSDTLFFGQTTTDQILIKFGKGKIKTKVDGESELPPSKYQKIAHNDLELIFHLNCFAESKKLARVKICHLSGIEIISGKYCLDGICLGSSISDIKDKMKEGTWGENILMNPSIADSCCMYYNDSSYFYNRHFELRFDVTKKPGNIVSIYKYGIE